jgi:hypothetical protein
MADEPRADDLVELGGRPLPLPGWLRSRLPGRLRSRLPGWPPSRGAAVLAAAALIVGAAAGYAAGDRQARGTAAPPRPTATASAAASGNGGSFSLASSPALTQGTGACSVQAGHELQLGVQVTNQSTTAITLRGAKAVLPLPGLKQVSSQWATCGAIPAGSAGPAEDLNVLLPGQSTWLSATFKVQVRCPGPIPVQFSVGYLAQGKSATESLPGFPDLGQVPYSGCPPLATST